MLHRGRVFAGAAVALGGALGLRGREKQVAGLEERPQDPPAHYQLVNAHVIFRHGARTPVFLLSGAENLEWPFCGGVNGPKGQSADSVPGLDGVSFKQLHVVGPDGGPRPHSFVDARQSSVLLPGGQCRMGQLTDLGAQQAASLGRDLRRRYVSLLDPAGSTVDARTTNVARCVATLSAVLGSLLPASKGAIVARTKRNADEDLTPNPSACPKAGQLMKAGRDRWRAAAGDTAEALVARLKELLNEEQARDMGIEQKNFVKYRDWVIAAEAHGVEKPWPLTELEVNTLDVLGALQVAQLLAWRLGEKEVECTRASLGKFIGEMVEEMSKAERKLYLVSAHDTTVLPLLVAFGVHDGLWPPFCANIAVELWENQELVDRAAEIGSAEAEEDRFLVRVVYNGEEKLRMTLGEFGELLQHKIPANWNGECGVGSKLLSRASGGSNF